MHGWRRIAAVTAVTMVTTLALGCGETPSRRGPIHGSITLGGQPLATGKVRFFALTGGISLEAEVRDGKYAVAAERGPTAGPYRVEVTSERKTGRRVPDRDAGFGDTKEETSEAIPPKFNEKSALKIDCDPAADRAYDFDLTAK